MIEAKFVHGGSQVGHVEDVVVDAAHRKKGLARELLAALANQARTAGCYKIILDCKEENAAFYEKCQYRRCERQMRLDLDSHAHGAGNDPAPSWHREAVRPTLVRQAPAP